MIFMMQISILLSLAVFAFGLLVFHNSKSHNYARINAASLRLTGSALIFAALLSLAFNIYVYHELSKAGKTEKLLEPFEIADPDRI